MMQNSGTTYGKLYNWYAVMGITVAEDATPTAAQIARKQLANRLARSIVMRNGRH
jgi:hypothetical protein